MSIFEQAIRNKYRFDTPKGQISVEELWDIPLTSGTGRVNLDDIARGLHRQLKNDDNLSFVVAENKTDETVQAKFDIVKHIIAVRIAEGKAASEARKKAETKQKIMSVLAEKQDDSLKNMSVEDLQKMLADL